MEFQGGSNNRLSLSDSDLTTVDNASQDSERVFDTSIILTAEPDTLLEEDNYPALVDIEILLIVFFSGTVHQVTSRGLLQILIQGEVCTTVSLVF